MTDWTQIVREHGPIVWKTVYRLLGNEADAADCFQNAFLAAVELSRKERVRNWPALVRRLATTSALERLRQRYRELSRPSVPADGSTVDLRGVGPDRSAEAAELAEHLCEALAELDPKQARAFCLARLEGFSYREIARQMGMTVNHVGVLLNRAKSALRTRLRAHDPAPVEGRFPGETQS